MTLLNVSEDSMIKQLAFGEVFCLIVTSFISAACTESSESQQ